MKTCEDSGGEQQQAGRLWHARIRQQTSGTENAGRLPGEVNADG